MKIENEQKKEYIIPTVEVIELEIHGVMMGSPPQPPRTDGELL